MELLPKDVISILFELLTLGDQVNVAYTCKRLSQMFNSVRTSTCRAVRPVNLMLGPNPQVESLVKFANLRGVVKLELFNFGRLYRSFTETLIDLAAIKTLECLSIADNFVHEIDDELKTTQVSFERLKFLSMNNTTRQRSDVRRHMTWTDLVSLVNRLCPNLETLQVLSDVVMTGRPFFGFGIDAAPAEPEPIFVSSLQTLCSTTTPPAHLRVGIKNCFVISRPARVQAFGLGAQSQDVILMNDVLLSNRHDAHVNNINVYFPDGFGILHYFVLQSLQETNMEQLTAQMTELYNRFPKTLQVNLPTTEVPANDPFKVHVPSFLRLNDTGTKFDLSYGLTPLHLASIINRPALVSTLLKIGANVNLRTRRCSYTPLMLACNGSHPEVVQVLLDAGADVNATDEFGWTALMHICCKPNGNVEVAKKLLEKQCDVFVKDKLGMTAIELACANSVDIAAILPVSESFVVNPMALFLVLKGGWQLHKAEKITLLIQKLKCRLDLQESESKDTPLLIAARADVMSHDAEAVILGSPSGVTSVNMQNSAGYTALHYAVARNDRSLVAQLVQAGADPCIQDNLGRTPLRIGCSVAASKFWILNLAPLLMPSVDVADKRGVTPLMICAFNGFIPCIHLFIDSDANVFAQDESGCTFLHTLFNWGGLASNKSWDPAPVLTLAESLKNRLGNEKFLELCSIRNKHLQTALHIAAQHGNCSFDLLNALCLEQLHLQQDAEGNNVLHLAILRGNSNLAQSLVSAYPACMRSINRFGQTPLIWAFYVQSLRAVKGPNVLSNIQIKPTTFTLCGAEGTAPSWLDFDHNANMFHVGVTFLIVACVTEELVRGTDLSVVDIFGKSAGQYGIASEYAGKASLFCKEVISQRDLSNGFSVMHELAFNGSVNTWFAPKRLNDTFQAALSFGADLMCLDHKGNTPLHLAAMSSNVDFLELALENQSVDVNATNMLGETPLFIAVQQGSVDFVRVLLNKAKDRVDTVKGPMSPLEYAATVTAHSMMVKLLLEHGVISSKNLASRAWVIVGPSCRPEQLYIIHLLTASMSIEEVSSIVLPRQVQTLLKMRNSEEIPSEEALLKVDSDRRSSFELLSASLKSRFSPPFSASLDKAFQEPQDIVFSQPNNNAPVSIPLDWGGRRIFKAEHLENAELDTKLMDEFIRYQAGIFPELNNFNGPFM